MRYQFIIKVAFKYIYCGLLQVKFKDDYPTRNKAKTHQESICDMGNIFLFKNDTLKQVTDNLRYPGGEVPDPGTGITT